MTASDSKEVTDKVAEHDGSKALGYIEGVQAANGCIQPLISAGIVNREPAAYFVALDDVVKEFGKLLAATRKA